MKGHLLTVGDEILIGQIVDTNGAWLGERLAAAGVDLRRAVTVGDGLDDIGRAIEEAAADGAALVVVTGGLGPTHDDLTRDAIARAFGRELHHDPEVFARIEKRYENRGRAMPALGRRMAEVPDGFEVLPNPKGTAPGLWGERDTPSGRQRIVALPGVPHEMKAIWQAEVEPRLQAARDGVVVSRTLLTVGRGESDIAEKIGETVNALPPSITMAYLPSLGEVRLRLTARGDDAGAARLGLDRAADALRQTLGTLVFGEGTETLEGVVLGALRERGRTLAVAESCTGGAVASRLTSVPGASSVFCGSVTAYSNAAKTALLDVPAEVIEAEGAVSEAVALALAVGARERFGASVGVSTTGIAGPTGGTPDKPVGTVWLGYDDGTTRRAVCLHLTPNRDINIGLSATAALDLVRRQTLRADAE